MAEIRKRYEASSGPGPFGSCARRESRSRRSPAIWGINDGVPATWISREKEATWVGLDRDERAELVRLRKENHALRMERGVLV